MSNDDLLSRWSRPNPLHFAALIIHSQQIAFSFSCRLDSIHALFPSKNRSVSPGNRQEQSLQAKSEASRPAPCADALLSGSPATGCLSMSVSGLFVPFSLLRACLCAASSDQLSLLLSLFSLAKSISQCVMTPHLQRNHLF